MRLRRADYQHLAAFRRELRQFLAFSEQVAHAEGIPPQQYQALLAIKGHPSRERMTVSDLSRELLVAQHTGSELVQRLAAKGLLTRTPDGQDRRRTLLSLTPASEAVLSKMARTHLRSCTGFAPRCSLCSSGSAPRPPVLGVRPTEEAET
jgi:DNA-binding MarR family transcriptional regulator